MMNSGGDIRLALFCFLVSFAFTVAAMPGVFLVCRKWNLYDLPGGRKVHHNAIPRLGGALFLPALLLAVGVGLVVSGDNPSLVVHASSLLLASGAWLIYLVGLVDDTIGVSARHKFIFQIGASAVLPGCNLYVNHLYGLFGLYDVPLWLGYFLTVFWVLLVVNAINLIDGIDGLASSLVMMSLAVFAWLFALDHAWLFVVSSCALMGAVAAFFLYNMWGRPERGTKIFMGDSGSLILGYALAYLSVKYAMLNPADEPASDAGRLVWPLTVLLIPVADLVRVAFGRMLRGRSFFSADKTHLHHKLLRLMPMRCALLVVCLLYVLLGGLAALLLRAGWGVTLILLVQVLLFTAVNFLLNVLIRRRSGASSASVTG